MSTHSARSDRAINCFFLCFFNFIFLVTKFEIGRNNLLLFQKLIYRTCKYDVIDVNVTKISLGRLSKILFHLMFLPLKGSLQTSSSASLDET